MPGFTGYMSVPGLLAAGDLSSLQYRVVVYNGTGRQVAEVGTNTTTTEHPAGILQDDPDTILKPADVAFVGQCKAVIASSVNEGDWLSYDSDGKLIADAAEPDFSSNAPDLYHIAVALDAGSSGDVITVMAYPAAFRGKA